MRSDKTPPQRPFKAFVKGNWRKIGLGLIALDLVSSVLFLAYGGPALLADILHLH